METRTDEQHAFIILCFLMDVIMNSSIGLLMLWPPAMMDGTLELWARISSEIQSDEPLQALARTSPTRQTIPSNWEPKESLSPLSHFQWVFCHTNKKSHWPSAHTHSFILHPMHQTLYIPSWTSLDSSTSRQPHDSSRASVTSLACSHRHILRTFNTTLRCVLGKIGFSKITLLFFKISWWP